MNSKPQPIEDKAIFKILKGIQNEWELEDADLARILHISISTLNDWNSSKLVPITPIESNLELHAKVCSFIDIFDLVSSLIYRKEERKKWIHKKNNGFGDISPLDVMKESPKKLYELRSFLMKIKYPHIN